MEVRCAGRRDVVILYNNYFKMGSVNSECECQSGKKKAVTQRMTEYRERKMQKGFEINN